MNMNEDTITVNLSVDLTADPALMRKEDYDFMVSMTPNERAELTREMRRVLGPVLHRLADERISKAAGPLLLDAARVRKAFDDFSKATNGGPSLAMQQHTPTWEAWKALCNAIFPGEDTGEDTGYPWICSSCGRKYSNSGVGTVCPERDCQFSCRPSVEP